MKLDAVMDEVAEALREITGINAFEWPVASLTGPAGYVSYPRSIDYDQTYQQGMVQFTDLPIVLLAGKPNDKSTRDLVAAWAAGGGPSSVKDLLKSRRWASCDDLTVTSCEFDLETVAGVPYLAAHFKATVVGPGGS